MSPKSFGTRKCCIEFHLTAWHERHLFCQAYILVTCDCNTQFPIWGQQNLIWDKLQDLEIDFYQVVLQNNIYTRHLLHPPWKYVLEDNTRYTWHKNPALSPLSVSGRSQLSRSPPPVSWELYFRSTMLTQQEYSGQMMMNEHGKIGLLEGWVSSYLAFRLGVPQLGGVISCFRVWKLPLSINFDIL